MMTEVKLNATEIDALRTVLRVLHANAELRDEREDEAEALVTVTLRPFELRLLRRGLAHEADRGNIDRNAALKRICQLDVLRWQAEESCADGGRSYAAGGRSSQTRGERQNEQMTGSDHLYRG